MLLFHGNLNNIHFTIDSYLLPIVPLYYVQIYPKIAVSSPVQDYGITTEVASKVWIATLVYKKTGKNLLLTRSCTEEVANLPCEIRMRRKDSKMRNEEKKKSKYPEGLLRVSSVLRNVGVGMSRQQCGTCKRFCILNDMSLDVTPYPISSLCESSSLF